MYVDCHSHVLPSGDDGAATVSEARALCQSAARHGTAVLFATPHVWPHLTLTAEREHEIRRVYEQVRHQAGLDLRLGYELTPTPELLADDPARYELAGTGCVLMEVPFHGALDEAVALAEHVEAGGLRPVIAHPERGDAVLADPAEAAALAERGWLLQVNGTSLLGRHGAAIQEAAWRIVDHGLAALVASDGHRLTRPPHLDEAYALVRERVGEKADGLFDGSALGLAVRASQLRSA